MRGGDAKSRKNRFCGKREISAYNALKFLRYKIIHKINLNVTQRKEIGEFGILIVDG
nr:MAG TPA: hypothetical protein [Caudoviricetes sp.]